MPSECKTLFDDEALSALVLTWQKADSRSQAPIWREIVEKTANYLLALIRSFKGDLRGLGTHEEIRAELVLHLHNRVLPAYRPGRGRLFSLVTFSCLNQLRTLIEKNQRLSWRYLLTIESGETPAGITEPEVYGLGAEIRERLDHYMAPGDDFEFFLVKNLCAYCYGRGGKGGIGGPTLQQIAGIVEEIVALSPKVALKQTRAAVALLQKELGEFRGRPSLYRRKPAEPFLEKHLPSTRGGNGHTLESSRGQPRPGGFR